MAQHVARSTWHVRTCSELCYNRPRVREPASPSSRSESREIAELRRLKQEQPDLGSAADLQIELLQLHRRVQARVRLPAIRLEPAHLNSLLAKGPILRFDDLSVDWSDVRLLLRATASAMRKHDALEETDFRRAETLERDAARLPDVIRMWYESVRPASAPVDARCAGLEPLIQQVMRPFLTRAAEAIVARLDLTGWANGFCPLCGGEPDLAVITPSADRLLICARCAARWHFAELTCPFCLNADRRRMTSFASRDGHYRLYACDVCERYLKAYDSRKASRPVMPLVDQVATLPLDAAAMQKGYK
jgi:hypothetical protein